ncbi:ankyrin repeat-containing domain protein [Mycena epipterygia]|nr:ankyrin repeat-containing domain protein [Mycena epipterygia]
MAPTKTKKPKSTPAHATPSKTAKVIDVSRTTLEIPIGILALLNGVTENVPYLNAITGCIQKLIDIQKGISDNNTRANDLLNNIWEVSRIIAQGLNDLPAQKRSTAVKGLEKDFQRYQTVLDETHVILKDWMSKGFVKRVLAHGDFPGIADGIDRRINAFRDAFSVARLISLSSGQDALDRKIQTVVDQATRTKLEQWLQPPNVAVSQRDAENKYHPKTGLWLLDRAEFREWIYAPSSLLWLHGISGSGKTVLSSTIIASLRSRAEPLAFFYFDTNNAGQQTVTQLLYSLVTQLSVQAPAPDKTLDALWSSHTRGQNLPRDSTLISEALLPILREFTEPVYIVLDALDECAERDKLIRTLTEIADAKLAHVHVLLTSRPEVPRNSDFVQRAVSLSLEGCVDPDIESYTTEILATEVAWIQDRKDEIKRRLLERGSGMFRLVALQLDELRNCDGRLSQVTKALADMPTSLDTIYDRILQNIKNPDMVSSVCRAINWLIFSKRPVRLSEIIDALAFDFESQPLRFNTAERMRPQALLAACAGFVTVSEDTTVKLAHASVKEYFLSKEGPTGLNGDCVVSEHTAHHLIARTCIAYLCSLDHVIDNDADLQRYPLTLYAVESWAFHVTHCDEIHLGQWRSEIQRYQPHVLLGFFVSYWLNLVLLWPLAYLLGLFIKTEQDPTVPSKSRSSHNLNVSHSSNPPQLIEEVMELLQLDSTQYKTLCCLYDNEDSVRRQSWQWTSIPILPPLYLAARVGLGEVVWQLLKQGVDVNSEGRRFGNALKAACVGGHTEIVHLLIRWGADVKAEGGYYHNALEAAASQGHTKIVHLLLEHGADVWNLEIYKACYDGQIEIVQLLLEQVDLEELELNSALEQTCFEGHIGIVNLLLEHGADVAAQGGNSEALQVAALRGHTEIVCLLLEKGAKVNTLCGTYGNPLQAASNGGYIKIVSLLLEQGADVNAQGGRFGNALQAASLKGDTEIVHLLLKKGAEVNSQGGYYGNALQAACHHGHTNITRLLLKEGANINEHGGQYGNALQGASAGLAQSCVEIVNLLLEEGADVNIQGGVYGNALLAASHKGKTNIVQLLLNRGANVKVQDAVNGSALQLASLRGHTEIMHLLIGQGADVNTQGGYYSTALQAASHGGHIESVHLLLEHGANVHVQGGEYGNAMKAATSKGHTVIAGLLLERGATMNTKDNNLDKVLEVIS